MYSWVGECDNPSERVGDATVKLRHLNYCMILHILNRPVFGRRTYIAGWGSGNPEGS